MRPIYTSDTSGVNVYGDVQLIADVSSNYIKKPATVQWAYQIVFNEPLYDAANSVNFELQPSEETELVIKILEMAGMLIKDISMYQVVNQEEMETIQQEKS